MREGGLRSAPAPRVTTSNRGSSRPPAPRVVPETVVIRQPAEVQRAPAKPDSNKVEIFKGSAKTELKFGKDSARRDTIPNN